ncbi:MAG TPA: FAD-binding oxidoreductase [Candidatus Limnocylindrales bacterium]|nr:FAD-binding oxidoreductase [Candidatus Limnocylindrales bacterium]
MTDLSASLAGDVLDELRARLRGPLLTPADSAYDAARGLFFGDFDPRPAAIARVADASDVATVVEFARRTGAELAVRAGGHSAAGHGSVDGGIVLDLRAMKGLAIDRASRTAWAEAGLTARELADAAARDGLAIGFGDTGSVGIAGLTLGGGIGYLVRKHGLTIDSLLGADVVTADGSLVRADETSHPDLFWAIRGGGGNFGVVTRFRFRLHELDSIVGGVLVLPATPALVADFVDAAEAAPHELSAIANVMPAPPLPFLPQEAVGRPIVLATLVHAGGGEPGERAVAPFRALASPIADLVRPMGYPEIYPPDDESYRPKAIARTLFVDTIDRASATTIVDALQASGGALRAVQIRVLGGAVARVPADATAYAHRASRIIVNVAALYDDPAERDARRTRVEALAAAIRRDDPGAYVNFLADEGPDRVRAAYPEPTWSRLAAIKARYDPTNLFRRNHNIPPATA